MDPRKRKPEGRDEMVPPALDAGASASSEESAPISKETRVTLAHREEVQTTHPTELPIVEGTIFASGMIPTESGTVPRFPAIPSVSVDPVTLFNELVDQNIQNEPAHPTEPLEIPTVEALRRAVMRGRSTK